MWLYVPSVCAPASAGLTSPSDWRAQALERSATWKGKPSPSTSWSRRWRHSAWIRHLCGRMLEPSTAALGVAAWISSLAASPASRTASPGSAEAAGTNGTSGTTSAASWTRPALRSPSSRTYPGCSPQQMTLDVVEVTSRRSSMTWPRSGSMRSGTWSARPTLARRIAVCGSTSSPGDDFPTPSATPYGTSQNGCPGDGRTHFAGRGKPSLETMARGWATPVARDANFPCGVATKGWRSLVQEVELDWTPGDSSGRRGQEAMIGAPSPRKLNPVFVEWLMGFPQEHTGSGPSETEWSRWLRRMPSELSRLER